jgi:arylsulfatase A-like enzyme
LLSVDLVLHAAARPNIVWIVADDLGYADVGFQGSKEIETPHLDALAASGVCFSSGYSSHPFCSPMRAGLLAGRYQHRFGYVSNVPYSPHDDFVGLSKKEVTVAKRLQKAGYRTMAIGKWHVGASHSYHPSRRGFDHFYGFLGGGHDYFKVDVSKPLYEGYFSALQRNGQPEDLEGYLTDRLSDAAVDFVSDQNAESPFFLYLAYNAPHTPMQAPQSWLDRYANVKDKKRRAYCAMVAAMDHGIGRVMAALEKAGLRESTLVAFLSDNGGPEKANGSDNGPLRGGKGDVFEGGVRVPFVLSWPGTLTSGERYEAPVHSIDLSATALALGEAEKVKGKDGVNLIPFLKGEVEGVPHEALFWRKGNGAGKAARMGKWKWLRFEKGPAFLYDLESDLAESKNLAKQHPDIVARLEKAYAEWDADNLPTAFPSYRTYHEKLREVHKEISGPKGR